MGLWDLFTLTRRREPDKALGNLFTGSLDASVAPDQAPSDTDPGRGSIPGVEDFAGLGEMVERAETEDGPGGNPRGPQGSPVSGSGR